jgi:hypothetical protein
MVQIDVTHLDAGCCSCALRTVVLADWHVSIC